MGTSTKDMREQKHFNKTYYSPCSPNDKNVGNGFEYHATEVIGAERFTKNLFLAGVPGSPDKT
jgi:murein tripeptide amidase MpaA